MTRAWVRETPARWDEGKATVLSGLEPTPFGLGAPDDGDPLGDEWWRVEDDGRVVGYGRLDDTWGDAEILVLVTSRPTGTDPATAHGFSPTDAGELRKRVPRSDPR